MSMNVLLRTLVASAALGGLLVWHIELRQIAADRAQVEYLTSTHAATIQRSVERALSATYPLAALVVQSQGEPSDFETLATKMLPYYQGAASLQLAPGGVVRRVVPLAGNEKAVGHDLLKVLRIQQSFRRDYLLSFADQSHFTHSFRQLIGYTPGEFEKTFDV